jgi:DNA-directed RNA polymerase specialized sigma24 family protein
MTVPTPDQPDQTGDSAIDLSQLSLDEATRAYRRELHVHCYRMVGSLEEAEDLVQETYLRAWRANPDVAHLDNPRAWLYKVATNRAVFFLTGFTHRPCATLTPRRPLSQPPVARLAFPRVGRRRSRPSNPHHPCRAN